MVTVKLLGAVRLLAMFQKMVRVKTKPPKPNARMLLEVADQLSEEAVSLEAVLVKTDERGEVVMMLTNCHAEPLHLEADYMLGTSEEIDAVEEMLREGPRWVSDPVTNDSLSCFRLEADLDPAGRSAQLLNRAKLLKLDVTALTMEQRDQLATLILKFADVSAVNWV